MKKKVGVVSLGCPKNLVDTEIMLGILRSRGYEISSDKESADIIIVNTCGFIETAKQESINTILEMSECKKNVCELLIVTGCMAERYKDQILEQIPDVDAVIGTGNYGKIAEIIDTAFQAKQGNSEKPALFGKLDEIEYLQNERFVSTVKGSAYLKIAEGCDNFCTYCIIPSLRGRYRSRKLEDILDEAVKLVQNGNKEIILVAQDTTRYGADIYGERKLAELIRSLGNIPGIEWIRLLYCYPEEIEDVLIEEMAVNPKVCKYIDIPVQHSSDKILKTMGRRGTGAQIRELLAGLRSRIPDIVIRTSLIVGFPGETEEDFNELYEFVRECRFDRLGVFAYSKEEDTPAARLKQQISRKVKEKRQRLVMQAQTEIIREKNESRLQKTYKTLVEGVSEDGIFYVGRTYAEAPEIDGRIYFTSQEPLETGEYVNVKVLNVDEYDLIGEVTYEFTK